jgi:hypothetical protein
MNGKTDIGTIAIVLIVLAILAWAFGFVKLPTTGGGGTPSNQQNQQGCYLATAPSETVMFTNKATGASASDYINYAYRKSGTSAWTTGVAKTVSITADPGSVVEFALAPDNTTNYGQLTTFTVPCQSYPTAEVFFGTIDTPASVTKTVHNTDGSVNSGAAPDAMAASDMHTIPVTVTGSFQKYIGTPFSPKDNVISCRYASANFTTVKVQDTSGITYQTSPSPSTLVSAAGFVFESYYMPLVASNSPANFQVFVQASATAPTFESGNVTCFIADEQLYYDSNDNLYKYGVVDETNSGIGYGSNLLNFTIFIS